MGQCTRRCPENCKVLSCMSNNGMREGRCWEYCKFENNPEGHIPHQCAHGHQWTVIEF